MTLTDKGKHIIALILTVLLFACVAALLIFVDSTPQTASAEAATTPKYSMPFDLNQTSTNGSGGGTSSSKSSGSGYSKTVSTGASSGTNITISIYGSGASGAEVYPGAIHSSTVTVEVSCSGLNSTLSVKNSAGKQIGSGSKSVKLTGLADGTYTATYTGSASWMINSRAGASVSITCKCTFIIDCDAPTLSGASTSSTGKYTNSAFTVTASDTGSGVASIHYMSPTASTYNSTTSSSYTVPSNSANGLWRFYVKDKAGNQSPTYYVYYDNTAPVGTIKNTDNSTLTAAYTNAAFKYTATDSGSGIASYEYKTPGATQWKSYTSGTLIQSTAANGNYVFRAKDKCGNYSAEKSIVLDTVAPTGALYGGTTLFTSGSTVNASYIKFVASDSSSGVANCYVKTPGSSNYVTYTGGSQYSVDGTYYFYCTDKCGNKSSTYSITLDNTAPVMNSSLGTFYETTGSKFSVSATDSSGVTLYMKTPDDVEYKPITGGSKTIDENNKNGRYYFYAVDGVGNETEKKWIELNVKTPTIRLYGMGEDTNAVYLTWDTDGDTGTLNGSAYTKGSTVSEEGDYTLSVSNYGRKARMAFSIEHLWIEGSTVPPTCTSGGYTLFTCNSCDEIKFENAVDALGHDYNEWETKRAATCTENGYEQRSCNRCGIVETQTLSALNHDYKTDIVPPTCLEQGRTDHTCRRCGNYYFDEVIEALGHNYTVRWIAPTCAHYGYNLHECTRCDDSYETDETPATGHNYVEEAIQATCESKGYIRHYCSVCEFEYRTDEVSAYGHDYKTEVTIAPTCGKGGERHFHCERCGKEYLTVIPATGHSYQLLESYEQDGLNIRIYECPICGKRYEENLGSQYEEVTDYIVYLFDLYKPYMWWILLAVAGVWSIVLGVLIAIANKNEDKAKAKRMLANYIIGLVVIAVILVAAPFLARGIALAVT